MRALFILDAQKGFQQLKDLSKPLSVITQLATEMKAKGDLIIGFQHVDDAPESVIYSQSSKGKLVDGIADMIDVLIQKRYPNAFAETNLQHLLEEYGVTEVVITGFNSEYCCLFTAIVAKDRGYHVTFIEDATDSVNNGDTYEMPNLDIPDFIGSILNWSGMIEVLYYDEFQC